MSVEERSELLEEHEARDVLEKNVKISRQLEGVTPDHVVQVGGMIDTLEASVPDATALSQLAERVEGSEPQTLQHLVGVLISLNSMIERYTTQGAVEGPLNVTPEIQSKILQAKDAYVELLVKLNMPALPDTIQQPIVGILKRVSDSAVKHSMGMQILNALENGFNDLARKSEIIHRLVEQADQGILNLLSELSPSLTSDAWKAHFEGLSQAAQVLKLRYTKTITSP